MNFSYLVRRANLNGQHDRVLASQGDRGSAVDYDWRRQKMYWSSTFKRETFIYELELNATEKNTGVLLPFLHVAGDANGLAVDWIAGNLYWTDQSKVKNANCTFLFQ